MKENLFDSSPLLGRSRNDGSPSPEADSTQWTGLQGPGGSRFGWLEERVPNGCTADTPRVEGEDSKIPAKVEIDSKDQIDHVGPEDASWGSKPIPTEEPTKKLTKEELEMKFTEFMKTRPKKPTMDSTKSSAQETTDEPMKDAEEAEVSKE